MVVWLQHSKAIGLDPIICISQLQGTHGVGDLLLELISFFHVIKDMLRSRHLVSPDNEFPFLFKIVKKCYISISMDN